MIILLSSGLLLRHSTLLGKEECVECFSKRFVIFYVEENVERIGQEINKLNKVDHQIA